MGADSRSSRSLRSLAALVGAGLLVAAIVVIAREGPSPRARAAAAVVIQGPTATAAVAPAGAAVRGGVVDTPTPTVSPTPSPTVSPTPSPTPSPSPTPGGPEIRIIGRKVYCAQSGPLRDQFPGLAGWRITATLLDMPGGVEARTVTDALGAYEFTPASLQGMAIPGARIRVCEEDRPGWRHVTELCQTLITPSRLPALLTLRAADFVNAQVLDGH